MNFGRRRPDSRDLEINVIPLIDILLVMLIFLASTTAFTRVSQLDVVLPSANSTASQKAIATLAVSQDGRYALDGILIEGEALPALVSALQKVASQPQIALTINADGRASHQSVVTAMQAARAAGIERVNFATRQGP